MSDDAKVEAASWDAEAAFLPKAKQAPVLGKRLMRSIIAKKYREYVMPPLKAIHYWITYNSFPVLPYERHLKVRLEQLSIAGLPQIIRKIP